MSAETLRTISAPPEYLPVVDPVADFTKDVLSVRRGGVIRIFTGIAHSGLYNEPLAVEALKYVERTREADIRLMTGPILIVGNGGHNGLMELVEDGTIRSYNCLPARSNSPDYRVVEGESGLTYYRESHSTFEHPGRRRYLNPARYTDWQWQDNARAAVSTFESMEMRVINLFKGKGLYPYVTTPQGYAELTSGKDVFTPREAAFLDAGKLEQ